MYLTIILKTSFIKNSQNNNFQTSLKPIQYILYIHIYFKICLIIGLIKSLDLATLVPKLFRGYNFVVQRELFDYKKNSLLDIVRLIINLFGYIFATNKQESQSSKVAGLVKLDYFKRTK